MEIETTSEISVIIPLYNEEDVINDCLESLSKQTVIPKEIIVVDDGSEDSSKAKVESQKSKITNLKILSQPHQGAGIARNLGAKHASGDILVFVDADMTFEPNFIAKLVEPIISKKAKGTFTRQEYVSNWENVWARCWNYNQGIKENRRLPIDYPDEAPVFRAILRSEFEKAGGFDAIGFTDDWTLSRKLGYKASVAKGAVCYHHNPAGLLEVYQQSRWMGKNEFYTRNLLTKVISLIRFFPVLSLFRGIWGTVKYKEIHFIIFKLTFDFGIWLSIILSFFGEQKYK